MVTNNKAASFILGTFILLALTSLGFFIKQSVASLKEYERTVTAKGLSEKEVIADIVIWPIQFNVASNNLNDLYQNIEDNLNQIISILQSNGLSSKELSISLPSIKDKFADSYGDNKDILYRYYGSQTITVYSNKVNAVKDIKKNLTSLGKKGIIFSDTEFETEYLFTKLNDIKVSMIENATMNARAVAEKFAQDSKSKLGKIKQASQGQFSVNERDKNNPDIKNVRVVTTVEYYLTD